VGSDPGVRQVEFEPELPAVIGAADCVWSRAGAGALSEIVYYGKPALLFPFPSAAENHQLLNAQYIIERGPAEIGTELEPVRQFKRSQALAELKEGYECTVSATELPEEIIAGKVIEEVQTDEKN
jgi:UDP-N-acetylglucosamine--N-acetylmuramyl-(pentapeptide) pyrophosphoryl-undecaprenol N-acetylglucosamine transferase